MSEPDRIQDDDDDHPKIAKRTVLYKIYGPYL